MSVLYYKKINETTIKLASDEQYILRELSDYFSFYAENYLYNPKYRNHLWDGKIRLVNLRNLTTLAGLLPAIAKFCAERNYTLLDQTEAFMKAQPDDLTNFDEWVTSLKLPFVPYKHQTDAVKHALQTMRALILSPTGSGKSCDLYMLTRWMLQHDRKVVIIVPSTSLVEQMHSDFKNYAKGDDTFDVDEQVHKLYSKIKTTDPYNDQCIITTWQSIRNYDNALFATWDCVMVDESHTVKAAELSKILSGAINAKYRLGFTGTLTGMVCHEYQITGLLGSVFQVTTTKQLQEQGRLSDCRIYLVDMKYSKEDSKGLWERTKALKGTYQDELDFVNHHTKRQLFIRNLVCSLKGTTLLLFRFREHGKLLYDLITEKVGDTRKVYHIDGTIDPVKREQIRNELKDPKSNAILVFSVATSSTGIDIKSIENLILSPSKSKVQTLQSIGRSLRLCAGKKGAKIFDLVDDLRTGRRRNFLYNLAQKRLEYYSEQGFDVDFKTVQF
jgi:superfamily II DNA or RNA helicase